ncbi:hypothetical protein L3X38_016183 [Prunus dulcis]|uniref:Uncharacterized protein n=1 Tax=Prunus dulcis TaxID=3755 RepID=A0AAD4W4V4_PRUDU|nr:hypothetical protein L3X38_016183 [Prunus dulcis]
MDANSPNCFVSTERSSASNKAWLGWLGGSHGMHGFGLRDSFGAVNFHLGWRLTNLAVRLVFISSHLICSFVGSAIFHPLYNVRLRDFRSASSSIFSLQGLSMRKKVILQPQQSISGLQQNGAITSIRGL